MTTRTDPDWTTWAVTLGRALVCAAVGERALRHVAQEPLILMEGPITGPKESR